MKAFDIPIIYRSPLITAIKNRRRQEDRMKKDFSPTMLDFGHLHIHLARHFGFCYGVENAIEIAFRTLEEHPGRRIFLLSEMIHNPHVNRDLRDRGVQFIMDTSGRQLLPWEQITPDDIVIVPAFGTTLETEARLREIGIEPREYNTTCPFVERVWNKAASIGNKAYTVIVHGKPGHEETRATFSHSSLHTPTVVVRNLREAELLGAFILGNRPREEFEDVFQGQYSLDFDPQKHLERVGVVNQTTMLARETQEIAEYFKEVMIQKYGAEEPLEEHFADTRDTLCYATNDNQNAVMEMLERPADLAIVVGGYNSSNTSHLVELCQRAMPTYFISSESEILSSREIRHWNLDEKRTELTENYLPTGYPHRIALTSGASCPDALVENVIRRLLTLYGKEAMMEEMISRFS